MSSVCPLIDHGQQPMKMHTEVTLLYKYKYKYKHEHEHEHIYIYIYIFIYLFNSWVGFHCSS